MKVSDEHALFNGLVACGLCLFLAAPFLVSPALLDDVGFVCAIRERTGMPCPSCGITSSIYALYAGNFGASHALHPMGIVVVAVAAVELALRPIVRAALLRAQWVAWLDLGQLVVIGATLAANISRA